MILVTKVWVDGEIFYESGRKMEYRCRVTDINERSFVLSFVPVVCRGSELIIETENMNNGAIHAEAYSVECDTRIFWDLGYARAANPAKNTSLLEKNGVLLPHNAFDVIVGELFYEEDQGWFEIGLADWAKVGDQFCLSHSYEFLDYGWSWKVSEADLRVRGGGRLTVNRLEGLGKECFLDDIGDPVI